VQRGVLVTEKQEDLVKEIVKGATAPIEYYLDEMKGKSQFLGNLLYFLKSGVLEKLVIRAIEWAESSRDVKI
jgi:hypothetical protein